MSKSQYQERIFQRERAIGQRAAKMTQGYLLQVIKQNLETRGLGGEKMLPLLKATKVKSMMGEYRLLGLNLNSSKVGFVLHYGFTGVREATKVYYNHSRFHIDSSQRKSHPFHLPEFAIFEDAYRRSGAVDYLIEELSKTRTEAIQFDLDAMVLTLNKISDGE